MNGYQNSNLIIIPNDNDNKDDDDDDDDDDWDGTSKQQVKLQVQVQVKVVEEVEVEVEVEALRNQLQMLRKRRRQIAKCRSQCQEQQEQMVDRLNQLRIERQETVNSYQSVLLQRQHNSQHLVTSQRWNVTNDCFHIWHVGPWATINGARMGGEAPSLPQGLLVRPAKEYYLPSSATTTTTTIATTSTSTSTTAEPPPQRRYLLWGGSKIKNNSTNNNNSNNNNSSSSNENNNHAHQNTSIQLSKQPVEAPLKVPWPEVNAALGHACLLLKVLQEKGGFSLTHDLHPMASTSKIGIRASNNNRRGTAAAPAIYNLYFQESSFSIFKGGLRNFNIALQALLQCIAEASSQQKDKTVAIPHAISHTNYNNYAATAAAAEWKIGGLPIAYSEATAVDFTRACKYLLTNLKWLVAYAVKHVDR